jgi:PadR family transcriptional regulator AphA
MQIGEPSEYAILGLLKRQPMHGYEMYQQFERGIIGQIVHLEMSQMYAFLKKLERLGCIEASLEPQGVRPPRKIYHLTVQGEQTFLQWLTLPVEKPRDVRIFFLIKLYFIQKLLPEHIDTLIEQQVLACQRFLQHLETMQGQQSYSRAEDEAFFERVVLRSRIYQTRALLDWMHELQTRRALF